MHQTSDEDKGAWCIQPEAMLKGVAYTFVTDEKFRQYLYASNSASKKWSKRVYVSFRQVVAQSEWWFFADASAQKQHREPQNLKA